MTLPNYTHIYNRIYAALSADTDSRGVPFEEVHKAAQGMTAALWTLYVLIEKENLPDSGAAVVDSVLELFQ